MQFTNDVRATAADAFDNKSNRKKILIVTCDLPSHPYAVAKLAKVLAGYCNKSSYDVTLAAPVGSALQRCQQETETTAALKIPCIGVGTVSTANHMSERPVTDPMSWKTLWDAWQKPFYTATRVNQMFDEQEGMYLPLKRLITNNHYDLVIGIHSVIATVADAVESVEAETGRTIPLAMFSSLPYDPGMYMGEWNAWDHPRSLTTFPHVSTYSAKPHPPQITSTVRHWIQRAWQYLDAFYTTRAWARSAEHNNARRVKRGLSSSPIPNCWQGYIQKLPVLCFGGVYPYLDSGSPIASNVTVIGSLDASPVDLQEGDDLKRWLDLWCGDDDDDNNDTKRGIVYASFGTGTILSEKEAAALVSEIASCVIENTTLSTLIALRASEQKRLRHVFDATAGSSPTRESDDYLEYLNGRLRIQADVPQSYLLSSGCVKAFISHMGMGGFVEGCKGGVPFISYPSGCDQWFNAQRAVDAGIGVMAPYGLHGIRQLLLEALNDQNLIERAREVSRQLSQVNSEQRTLMLVEKLIGRETDSISSSGRALERRHVDVIDPYPMKENNLVGESTLLADPRCRNRKLSACAA